MLGIILIGLTASYAGVFYFAYALRGANDSARAAAVREAQVLAQYTAVLKAQEREASSTVLFAGDVMLSRGVGRMIARNGGNAAFPFALIASSTRSADVFVGNLEGPISSRGEDWGNPISFRADPGVVPGLVSAGFGALTLANNHMLDWGRAALADTVELLNNAGVKTVGAGRDEEAANQPLIVNTKGGHLALLGYTNLNPKSFEAEGERPGTSHFDADRIADTIRALKERGNVVAVLVHWGEEYRPHATAAQKAFAHALIDAGADLVIGSHPHVLEEVEHYKNGWIAYSLGTFVFDQNVSDATNRGGLFEVHLRHGAVDRAVLREVRINENFQPQEVRL